MIKIENVEVVGWEHAIRGMRNPMNSWEKSDSQICNEIMEEAKRRVTVEEDQRQGMLII